MEFIASGILMSSHENTFLHGRGRYSFMKNFRKIHFESSDL